MKIGLVVPGFSADERDWCIPALLNFVRTLAADNEVHVFALEYPYRRERYCVYGATVHSMDGRNRGKWYAPRLWSSALSSIRAQNTPVRFDALHAFWVNEAGFIAALAARALRIPVVASVAGGELVGWKHIDYGGQQHFIERSMIRWVMQNANRITTGSRYLQKIASAWRADARVLPFGVDTQMFSPQRVPSAEIKILNVGSLVPVKGQENLLQAFGRLGSSCILEIVGGGIQEGSLRACANRLGISDRVKWRGALPHDAIIAKYRAADVFVQAARHEAQGMATLEAAACGIAIAGTPTGILPELAERGAAVTARGYDPAALADAIASAIETRKEIGCRARQVAEQEFSLKAAHARWMGLYHSLNGTTP